MEYTISINISGDKQELKDVYEFIPDAFEFVQEWESLGVRGSISCECAPRAVDPHWISLMVDLGVGIVGALGYDAIKCLIKSFAKLIQTSQKFKGFVYLKDKKDNNIKLENSIIDSKSDINKMIEELDQIKQDLEKQLQEYNDDEDE